MTNPHLTVNLFKIRTKNAVVGMSHTANVIGHDGNQSMGTVLLDHFHNMNKLGQKGYISFTSYRRNHQKEDIEYCSAVMLEYPYSDLPQLTERLSTFPFTHYQIDTQSDADRRAEARVLVAFPLVQPITSPREYTRVASLLWEEIGMGAKTKGSISSTFLFCPYTVNPRVQLYSEGRDFIDAETYLTDNKGNWVDARENAAPEFQPATVSDDGLWAW
jgi:hypothetical protein